MVKSLKDRTGKYGMAKYKAFASLEHRERVPSRELLLLSGLKYNSLTRLLGRWVEWEYVDRQPTYKFGIGTYEYKLTSRGRGWLVAARAELPMAAKFESELQKWHKWIIPMLSKLMNGKFKDAVNAISIKNIR